MVMFPARSALASMSTWRRLAGTVLMQIFTSTCVPRTVLGSGQPEREIIAGIIISREPARRSVIYYGAYDDADIDKVKQLLTLDYRI